MMKLPAEAILVVGNQNLFGLNNIDSFEGFRPAESINYRERILENIELLPRAEVEESPIYKQPVIYAAVVNPIKHSVFVYHRRNQFSFRGYTEKRLTGKWSIGIGGHIIIDRESEKVDNTMELKLSRKLESEVIGLGQYDAKLLGYLYSEVDEISRQHFGLLYEVETESDEVRSKDPEMGTGSLQTFDEAGRLFSSSGIEVEVWTRISLAVLMNQK